MAGPLENILVLDFSTLLPGPMASLILANAGAEVIKIERPGQGDEMRTYSPKFGSDSVNFALLNRGKKSLALDLKDPADQAALRPLVERADVLIEQFRPGVMARLGLDHATLSGINPGLVYCSITGYGQDGPLRDVAGHDLNYQARSGLLSLSMGEVGRPVVPGALIADIAGGAYPAVMNILLALEARHRDGMGRHLDIAMCENLFPFMYWALADGFGGKWPGNGDALTTGGTPRYRLYTAADGKVVAAAPIEDRFWRNFCDLIGLEEHLRDDARDPDATIRRVAELIAARSGADWERVFETADCCCNLVKDVREAVMDPHFTARGLFPDRREGQPVSLPLPLVPALQSGAASAGWPALGAHNATMLE